jgi:hypothetical protein
MMLAASPSRPLSQQRPRWPSFFKGPITGARALVVTIEALTSPNF